MRAFLTHFDVYFALDRDTTFEDSASALKMIHSVRAPPSSTWGGPASFTTGPKGPTTHWQQVAFLLRDPLTLPKGKAPLHYIFFSRKEILLDSG